MTDGYLDSEGARPSDKQEKREVSAADADDDGVRLDDWRRRNPAVCEPFAKGEESYA